MRQGVREGRPPDEARGSGPHRAHTPSPAQPSPARATQLAQPTRRAASMRWKVSGMRGQCRLTRSLSASSSSRGTYSAPRACGCGARGQGRSVGHPAGQGCAGGGPGQPCSSLQEGSGHAAQHDPATSTSPGAERRALAASLGNGSYARMRPSSARRSLTICGQGCGEGSALRASGAGRTGHRRSAAAWACNHRMQPPRAAFLPLGSNHLPRCRCCRCRSRRTSCRSAGCPRCR